MVSDEIFANLYNSRPSPIKRELTDLILDYEQGIDARCGKDVKVYKDVIITPFYTEDYCKLLVKTAKNLDEYFDITGDYGDMYSNKSLHMNKFSHIWYEKYANHCKEYIKPAVDKEYIWPHSYTGVFPPFINKFGANEPGQTDMDLHCEASAVSIVVKLNNDFEGGSLVFPRQEFGTRQFPTGTAFIFPGWVTHPHYVEKITGGEDRYTLVGFSPPPQCIEKGITVFDFNHMD